MVSQAELLVDRPQSSDLAIIGERLSVRRNYEAIADQHSETRPTAFRVGWQGPDAAWC